MIVVYHPSKAHLTTSETKTGTDLGMPQLGQSGHYFSCEHCGNSGPIRTGEGSRLAAVFDARRHACRKYKAEWRKQADGAWTMTAYGVGYTYKFFGGELLNVAIRAALDKRATLVGQ